MVNSIVTAEAAAAVLEPAPIFSKHIIAGSPKAKNKMLAKSRDGTTCIWVWECTPGSFIWHYAEDETLVVISGEAFVTDDKGVERRLGLGDMAFFPGGSSSTWRVTERVRKVAITRKDLPSPVGFGVRAWHKFLRIAGLRGGSSLTQAIAD